MKNKFLIITLVLVVAVLSLFAYNNFFGPHGIAGGKHVTVRILIADRNIDKGFNFRTDDQFLYDLLKENQEKLGVSFQKYDFGSMVVGMMNYKADQGNNEYFHIYVNGESASTGLQQIALKDEDSYKFALEKW